MLHDSDASTLAPESPLNTYESAKDTKAINLVENIKIRLRCKTNKTDFVDNCKSKNPKTLATSKKEPVQSNSTKYKNDSKSTNGKCGKRKVSKSSISKTTHVKKSDSSKDTSQKKHSMDKQFESEKSDEKHNESFEQVSEKFKILQENWSLRWEILHLKWQQLQSIAGIRQPIQKEKSTSSEDAPIIEISAMWKMFMDNMALFKIDTSQDGSIVTYSLESTKDFFIFQEPCVSSSQRISFLLYLLHKIVDTYKLPEASLQRNGFEDKQELFYQVWKSLTTMLCDIPHPQDHLQIFWQNLQQFLIGLFSDIIYGNIQETASEKCLQIFFHTDMIQIPEYLVCQLKIAIVAVLDRFKTALLELQPHHLLLKRYTDLVLLLERLPFSIWEEQHEWTLTQIATTLTGRFPFAATLLFAVSLHHKYRAAASEVHLF